MKYGFVCVVTGAQQPVGQAIIQELAGMFAPNQADVGSKHSEWAWIVACGSLC